MAEFKLNGYLTCGKYTVNDYTIYIERVKDGVEMRIVDGDGNVQVAKVNDGEYMRESERQAISKEITENKNDMIAQVTAAIKKLQYVDGDVIAFDSGSFDDNEKEGVSHHLIATGYVDNDRILHVKIPVAKSLRDIKSATCESFYAMFIYNDNVYSAYDEMTYIKRVCVDKVQNCIIVSIDVKNYGLYAGEQVIVETGGRSVDNPAIAIRLNS